MLRRGKKSVFKLSWDIPSRYVWFQITRWFIMVTYIRIQLNFVKNENNFDQKFGNRQTLRRYI